MYFTGGPGPIPYLLSDASRYFAHCSDPSTHHLYLAEKLARSFSKQNLIGAVRALGPALVVLTFASAAHAQGTMDFSGAQTLMGTFKTFITKVGFPPGRKLSVGGNFRVSRTIGANSVISVGRPHDHCH